MSDFDVAVEYVLRNEGGLEQNSNDPGGITNMGISLRLLKAIDSQTLKSYGIYGDVTPDTIKALSKDEAKAVYRGEFWNHAPFEKIRNQEHCNYIFSSSVNLGISPAIKCVQRASWSVMKTCALKDDGVLGDKTIAAIKMCGFLIMPPLRSERANYYRLTVENAPQEKEFLNGWLKRAYESN